MLYLIFMNVAVILLMANFLATTFRDPGSPTAYKLEVFLFVLLLKTLERRVLRQPGGMARRCRQQQARLRAAGGDGSILRHL